MGDLSNVDWKDFVRVLRALGYEEDRQQGDHHCFIKPGVMRPVVVNEKSPLAEFVVKSNLRTMGLDRKEFLRLLRK